MHTEFEKADCDVLLLYDCDHSVQPGEPFHGKGMVETLASSPLDPKSTTPNETHHSFTPSLVQELAHAAHSGSPLSIVELHRRLISRQQTLAPKIYFTDDTYSIVQVDRRTGHPIVEPDRQRLPTHNTLSSTATRTIVLSPLKTDTPTPPDQPLVLLSPPSPRPPSQSHTHTETLTDGPSVLLAVRLRDQTIDADKWKTWLANAPTGAKGITITAVYPSFSLLLLVKMPIAVWDMLPVSPAVSFVGYTSGRDFVGELNEVLGTRGEGDAEGEGEGGGAGNQGVKVAGKVGPSGGNHETAVGHRRRNGQGSFLNGHQVKTSVWPDVFTRGQPEGYSAEEAPHCLRVSEAFLDDESTQAQRIIREFVKGTGDPSEKYIRDDIEQFCSPAYLRQPEEGGEGSETAAISIVGEKARGVHETKLLGRNQLLDGLLPSTVSFPATIWDVLRTVLTDFRATHSL